MYSNKSAMVKDLDNISRTMPKLNMDIQGLKDKMKEIEDEEARNKNYLNKMNKDLNLKLDISYKDEVQRILKEYCAFRDIQNLRNEVHPTLTRFVSAFDSH